jgi:hypothetical protein
VFVEKEKEEKLENSTTVFPFRLIFPLGKGRVYYCSSEEDRNKWMTKLKQTVG